MANRWWALDVDWLDGHRSMLEYGEELRSLETSNRRSRYLRFRSPDGPSRSRGESSIASPNERALSDLHVDVLEEDGMTETQSVRTRRTQFRHPLTEHFACVRFMDKAAKEDYKAQLREDRSRALSGKVATSPLARKVGRRGPKHLASRKGKAEFVHSFHTCQHKRVGAGSVKGLCQCQLSFGNLAQKSILQRKHERADYLVNRDKERAAALLRKYKTKKTSEAKSATSSQSYDAKKNAAACTEKSGTASSSSSSSLKTTKQRRTRTLLLTPSSLAKLAADEIILGKKPPHYPPGELHDFAQVKPSHACVARDAFRNFRRDYYCFA